MKSAYKAQMKRLEEKQLQINALYKRQVQYDKNYQKRMKKLNENIQYQADVAQYNASEKTKHNEEVHRRFLMQQEQYHQKMDDKREVLESRSIPDRPIMYRGMPAHSSGKSSSNLLKIQSQRQLATQVSAPYLQTPKNGTLASLQGGQRPLTTRKQYNLDSQDEYGALNSNQLNRIYSSQSKTKLSNVHQSTNYNELDSNSDDQGRRLSECLLKNEQAKMRRINHLQAVQMRVQNQQNTTNRIGSQKLGKLQKEGAKLGVKIEKVEDSNVYEAIDANPRAGLGSASSLLLKRNNNLIKGAASSKNVNNASHSILEQRREGSTGGSCLIDKRNPDPGIHQKLKEAGSSLKNHSILNNYVVRHQRADRNIQLAREIQEYEASVKAQKREQRLREVQHQRAEHEQKLFQKMEQQLMLNSQHQTSRRTLASCASARSYQVNQFREQKQQSNLEKVKDQEYEYKNELINKQFEKNKRYDNIKQVKRQKELDLYEFP